MAKQAPNVTLYDTTLRDGTQGEDTQISVRDKLQATELLDELGVSYIEGGWPGSNPRDESYFADAKKLSLKNAKLTAFGATRRAGLKCADDPSLQALIRSEVPVLTIFGKCWGFQAREALRITEEENLELIGDTVAFLKGYADEVIFDAEHFFDGYAEDAGYAMKALRAAESGGADCLALCDTNGGTLPDDLEAAVTHVVAQMQRPIGIHTHNDSELAVANALAAVRAGASMVQGTVNGYGERCGNANLISIIPALKLKMGIACVTDGQLARLRMVARTIDELANRTPIASQAYVGRSAFAHKGGVHVDAVKKNPRTYEHIEPEKVGNVRRILLSDLSGKANIELKARELGVDLDAKSPETKRILEQLKSLENRGYQFESAGASFKLVVERAVGTRPEFFKLRDLQVHVGFGDKHPETQDGETSVHIEIAVGEQIAFTTAIGNGPVHAMDKALRSLLDKFYPELDGMRLVDYKVRVLTSGDGTGSVVRVLIQSADQNEVWGTVGVSPNIIHASWDALLDAVTYKLMKAGQQQPCAPEVERAATDDASEKKKPRGRRLTARETLRSRGLISAPSPSAMRVPRTTKPPSA